MKSLEKEFQFYLDHQDELVEKYNGNFIAIKNGKVIGVFDSQLDAVEELSKEHELGTFLIQRCEPGEEAYTHTIHYRVVFA
jgi:hypothetical protein